jgi:hypothetical protein
MRTRRINSNCSGQALIVTSLVIATLLLSTAYYVFEIRVDIPDDHAALEYTFFEARMSAMNTVVSALSNFSNGGDRIVLKESLDKLASAFRDHSHGTEYNLLFTLLNSSSYQDGMRISWGFDGAGISSAYASFLLNVTDSSTTYSSKYDINVTTGLTVTGTYVDKGNEESVNTTCTIYDEAGPTLAKEITMFFQNETDGPWRIVGLSDNLNVMDYGNGTYLVSFDAYTQNVLKVSASIHDFRDIFATANATCSKT